MKKRLRRQVDKINDTGDGDTRQIIIRARTPRRETFAAITAAANAIRQRRFAGSARDLLPSGAPTFAASRGAEATKMMKERTASLAAQTALQSSYKTSIDQMRKAGLQAANKMLELEPIAKTRSSGSAKDVPQSLWIGGCVVATLDKDGVESLPDATEQDIDIFANNPVWLPDYARAQALPTSVSDNKTSSWGVEAIGALSAWGAYGARGNGVKVAVLDTGVDATHPDVQGKLAGFAEFDATGNQVPGAQPHDTLEHGTHVAGTILGGGHSGAQIGVAPDAELLAGIVLPGGSGFDAQIIAGMQWALESGADIINMSLGGLTFDPQTQSIYTEAIINALLAGVPVVTAIGNDGDQVTGPPGNDLLAFSVGATDQSDSITGFSGGRTHVLVESDFINPEALPIVYMKPEISAPGFAVQSSVPNGGWAAFSGTSMATPHVAGAAALLLSGTSIRDQQQGLDRAFLIQDLLTGSAEELGERGQDQRYGFGRLNALRAIGKAHELGFASNGPIA